MLVHTKPNEMSVDCDRNVVVVAVGAEDDYKRRYGFHALFIDAYRKLGKYDLKPVAFVVGTRTSLPASVTGNFTL